MKVKVQKPTLSPNPVHSFTNRECTSILGSLIGGLVRYAGVINVREAVNWWATNPEAWELMQAGGSRYEEILREQFDRKN
jgi:hypothetical protein